MPIYSAAEYEQKYGHKIKRHPIPTDCATSNYPRIIHPEKTWRLLQKTFYEQTYAKKSYHHRVTRRHANLWYSGIDDEYVEARDDGDGRGRGMYAIRDIPRGTQVWYSNLKWVINDGYWKTKESMVDFLTRLPHDIQCDVLLWAYAAAPMGSRNSGGEFKWTSTSSAPYVECNLDEASYFNHAEKRELVNMGLQNRALRDIKKGEELLMDYRAFIATGSETLPWWDEIRNTAWQESSSSGSDNQGGDALSNSSSSGMMDDYVKYGAPKDDVATVTISGTGVVDALSFSGVGTKEYDYFSILGGLSLALVLARGLAKIGMRR